MALADQMKGLRHSVGLSVREHVGCLRVAGDAAFDALDAVCPRNLYLHDGRALHTLLLDAQAHVLADLIVARDDDEYLVFTEGLGVPDLIAHLREHCPRPQDLALEDLSATHAVVGLDGPYAWELVAEIAGAGVIGAPFLSLFQAENGILALRGGKTGEYGYDLLVPRPDLEGWLRRLRDLGQPLDLVEVGLEALEQCALENWFFNVRREGQADVTPLELQLQWRLSWKKSDFVGANALRQRREDGIRQRLTCIAGEARPGDPVRWGTQEVGRVVNAGAPGSGVSLGLLDLAWAHPGIDGLALGTDARPARTVCPPVIDNRSLHVNPQRHRYGIDGKPSTP